MSDINKLFVLVPSAKCEQFRNKYISPASGERDEKYDNRLVFLEDSHELWTKNAFYSSGADVTELKKILHGFSYTSPTDPTLKTVKGYIDDKFEKISDAVTLEGGSSDLTTELSSETLTNENVGDMFVIDEPSTGATDGKYHFTLDDDPHEYIAEIGDKVIVSKVNVTTHKVEKVLLIERNLDGAVTTAGTLTANHIVLGNSNQSVQDSSYVTGSDNVTAANFGTTTYTLATEQGVKTFVNDSAKKTTIEGSTYIDITYSYSNGVYSYTAYAYTQSLIDATGITYNSATGKWVAADDPSVEMRVGLAVAYDVAYELVKDERVIAAALNDHESRISDIEEGGSIAGLNADITYTSTNVSYQVTETTGIITNVSVNIDPVLTLLENPWDTYNS